MLSRQSKLMFAGKVLSTAYAPLGATGLSNCKSPIPKIATGYGTLIIIIYLHIMEGYSIDRIYILHSFFLDTMTLEGIFPFLNFWARVKILHSYSTLNGA